MSSIRLRHCTAKSQQLKVAAAWVQATPHINASSYIAILDFAATVISLLSRRC
jgi:hypothetical protein